MTPDNQSVRREYEDQLQAQYNSKPKLKKLADKIHISRMMSGHACSQCIEIALIQLEKAKRDARKRLIP